MPQTRAFLERRSVKSVFLLSVLLIACLPRFIGLQHPSMTCDESSDYNDSLRFLRHMDLRAPISDGYLNGQLPFVVTSLFNKFLGNDEWVARGVSAVFSLLAICAVFFVSRALFGYWWALLTALMLGFVRFIFPLPGLPFPTAMVFPLYLF